MTRSKHTDPYAIRASRRVRAPRDGRGSGDARKDRARARALKALGLGDIVTEGTRRPAGAAKFPRITVARPRRGFHHPDFRGSTSIKRTLPVLVPGMTYDGMAIGDGDSASAAFARMARQETDAAEIEGIRANLLKYCKQDTLAMVRLHEQLLRLTS